MTEYTKVSAMRATRRDALMGVGGLTLSVAALGLMSGRALAGAGDAGQDVAILNTALGLEHEAINAYQLGAESGLLKKPALEVAIQFQSHHKAHADALRATIDKLGGQPVAAKAKSDYALALNAAALKTDVDVLRLAARLEKGAIAAYIGVIPAFADRDLAQVAARLAADETMHWTALSNVLGDALPVGALSVGA